MSRPLPPLNALRAFEAAARHQSFSRAADELGVSHSAISRHVRGLEHRLSVRLFRDLPRGVALTADGERYLATVAPAFDQIAEATDALRGRPEGVVVVNSEVLFALKWVVPQLGKFKALYPEIEVRLDASSTMIDIDRYEADLAIRFFRSGRPDRPAELLSNSPIEAFAAPEVAKRLARPEDIVMETMLRDRLLDLWPDWFAACGVDAPTGDVSPTWRMRGLLAIEAALHGQGVVLASRDVMLGHIAQGRLQKCFDAQVFNGAYFLVSGDAAARRKPVRVFREWLLNEARALRDPDGPGLDYQPVG